MRTLKKTLCLVLVLVMMAGLCSIGTSAAFADADKIQYTEAAEVLNGLGVMKGDENGFRPQDGITRAEACVMIVRMLDAEGIKGTANFTDLAGYGWAKDAIAYCEAEGIVAGNGDGTFNPGGKLTGYAFAKMLFCAAGYNAEAEGMIGANWEIGVAKLVKAEEIAKAIAGFDGTAACTREEAAQLAFKTLTDVTMRKYLKGTTVGSGDITVSVGGEYDAVYDLADNRLIAENFGITPAADYNALGQPVMKYINNAKKINCTVRDEAVVTFTAKTSAKDVATALAGYKLVDDVTKIATDTETEYKINNITTMSDETYDKGYASTATLTSGKTVAEVLAALTANGKLVEFYANKDNQIIEIVENTYTTDKIADVKTDKKTGEVSYKIGATWYLDSEDATADKIVFKTAPAKGDIVTIADNSATVKYVYATTNFTGAQSATTTSNGVQTVTIGGTKYTVSEAVYGSAPEGVFNNNANEAVYYLDQYGYLVYTTSTAASTDYAYIVDAFASCKAGLDGDTFEVTVRAILADGTVGTYGVALKKDATGYKVKDGNTVMGGYLDSSPDAEVKSLLKKNIYGYTLSDGVMTLEDLTVASSSYNKGDVVVDRFGTYKADYTENTTVEIGKKTSATSTTGSKTVLFNSATKVIAYNADTKTATVFNGTSALPAGYDVVSNVVTKANADNGSLTATLVFTETAVDTSAGKDIVYIDATKYVESLKDGKTYYIYTGTYANGDTIELTSEAGDPIDDSGLYNFAEGTIKDSFQLINEAGKKANDSDPASTEYIYDTTLTVTSDMLGYTDNMTEKFANITDATEIVYVNSKLDEVNGNGGYVVLEKVNGNFTGNVAKIFITVD